MKNKKIIAILLAVLTMFTTLSLNAFAAGASSTHDFSEVSELDAKYSYGTIFWTDKTEVSLTSNNQSSFYKKVSNRNFRFGAKAGEIIEVKITNCAVDEDGDICDVICGLYDIEDFKNTELNNRLADYFDVNPEETDKISVGLSLRQKNGDLIDFSFGTNAASGRFFAKYVKRGTNTPANIHGAGGIIYDLDIQVSDKVGDVWNGNEGFSIEDANGEVYYRKNNWLIDTADGKGVRTPDKSVGTDGKVENNDGIEEHSCAFLTEQFDDATVRFFYSGYSCGISYCFASPYPFKINKPIKNVDKTLVKEGEKFNYSIEQYVPNNYYASIFDFVNAYNYTSFTISDVLDSNLVIDGKITVTDESGVDVSSYFNISQKNNKVVATLKPDYLKQQNFYAKIYSLNIPVYIKEGTGKVSTSIKNTATTVIERDDDKTSKLNSNTVSTTLSYNLFVSGEIDHGRVAVNDSWSDTGKAENSEASIPSGTNKASIVSFEVEENYVIESVVIDGQVVDASKLTYKDGVYTYTFNDAIVDHDVEHIVEVKTVLKSSTVVARYVDEEGNEIAEEVIINGKVSDAYKTDEKDIKGYELIEVFGETSGVMSEGETIVTYIYRAKEGKVVVKFVDKNGNEIAEEDIIEGTVFSDYVTEAKDINGYVLVKTPDNAEGQIIDGTLEVIYVYDAELPPVETGSLVLLPIGMLFAVSALIFVVEMKKKKFTPQF